MTDVEYRALYQGEWEGRSTPLFPALGWFRERETWVRQHLTPRAARLFVCWAVVRNSEPSGPGSSAAEEELEELLRNAAAYATGNLGLMRAPRLTRQHLVWMGERPYRQGVIINSLWREDPYPDAARCGLYESEMLALFARPLGWRSSWETEDVLALAAAANADPLSPRQDLAPILADALEEAGVDGEGAALWLARLRSHPHPYPPGAWVLEYGRLLEGKR